jgi:signal transduction histidine kinase/ligand-binding sensor domain-containing protein
MHCGPFARALVCWLVLAGIGQWHAAGELKPAPRARAFRIRHWTTEDGLPSNTVLCLLQAHNGYLWIGTKRGLARFDGGRFKVFIDELRVDGSDDLRCYELAEDNQGRIWVRLAAGLVCYQHGVFTRYSILSGPLQASIQTMIVSKQGGLWIGTKDEGVKKIENGRFTRSFRAANGLWNDRAGLLREDPEGRLWIGCADPFGRIASWQRLDPRTGELRSLQDVLGINLTRTDLRPDSAGRLWLSTTNQLLCWGKGKLKRFDNAGLWNDQTMLGIVSADRGDVWLVPGFTGRLVYFHDGTFDPLGMEDGLADSDFRSVLADREGNIWVGTGSGGLQQLRPGGLRSLLTMNRAGWRQQIDSVCPGRDGVVWLGAWPALLRWENGSVRRFTYSTALQATGEIHAHPVLEDHRGQVWLGAKARGLFRLEGDEVVHVLQADDGRTNWQVRALYEDPSGTLWVGSDSGLSMKCGDHFVRLTTHEGLLNDTILGMIEGPDGSLWVGTLGGLQRFKDGRFLEAFTKRQGLLSDAAYPLLVQQDGGLWVGTPEGLNRLRNGKLEAVTLRQGLRAKQPFCLLDDHNGYYWANSIRGIFRMPKVALDAVADGRLETVPCISYGESDGAASAEGTGECQPNAAQAPEGRMWFPTTRGVVVLDPGKLVEKTLPPPVVIEEVVANDRAVMADGRFTPYGAQMRTTPFGPRLPPGQAQVLELRYTANTFVAPGKARFRYRLEGADAQWRQAGTRRVAFYTNLKPGRYRFFVKASNGEGVWSEHAAEFGFTVAPHLYETWPFYTATALLLGAAAFGFHYLRLKGLRQIQLLESQRALAEERGRIARDLHDDLGASLTGIALQLEAAQRRGQAQGAELGVLAGEARSLTHEMRELAWTTNPRCDNLSSVVAFITESAECFCRAAGLSLRLELPSTDKPWTVPAQQRHHLLAVLKESLANTSKHAAARNVTVGLRLERGKLELKVQDDGRGFDASWKAAGSGLQNMRERVQQLGGVCRVESQPGAGTTVTVVLPTAQPKS